jgi:hypothetical protein
MVTNQYLDTIKVYKNLVIKINLAHLNNKSNIACIEHKTVQSWLSNRNF